MICPNCSKELNGFVEYCNECGCKVDGSLMGEFKTDFYFVFKHPQDFIFVNSKNGHQLVLRASTLEELEKEVKHNGFFWMSKNRKEAVKTHPVLDSKDIFMPASSLKSEKKVVKKPNNLSNGIRFQKTKSIGKSPFEPFKITDKHVKRNPNVVFKNNEAEEVMRQDYGILGVFKDISKSAPTWVYKSPSQNVAITERTLEGLKNKVESKGFKWIVVNNHLADESFKNDLREIQARDSKIKAKNAKNNVDVKKKAQIRQEMLGGRPNENSTRLDRMFR
ncbi:hypothetical protein [Methanobrevibacter sp.]|uniref:hypothetical protein n=1 Tax=Methanobrevibacter sp. TaxID=66852 RepID=UPI0038667919